MFAVVRIKGRVNVRKDIEKTLNLMRLYKKHCCVILPPKKDVLGMIQKVERYVTWGEINADTLSKLLEKRGRLPGNKRLTEDYVKEKTGKSIKQIAEEIIEKQKFDLIPGVKKFFRLKPPTKGLESIKKPYSLGGALGYRGKSINDLIKRMI
ncbi:MAG: 50S ribosomal protein L30 [Nanoarchaeota archaeon]|nr:50S ribosomal protein L30 [Nanoarchaeota archaeon]